MTDISVWLVRNTYIMIFVAIPYILSYAIAKKYAPNDFYNMGKLILFGFVIPFRPEVLISFSHKRVIGEAAASLTAIRQNYPELVKDIGQMKFNTFFEANTVLSLGQVIFIIWITGFASVMLYHLVKHVVFMKMVKRWSADISDQRILTVLSEMKELLEIKSQFQVKYCACISSPILLRIINPVILLPNALLDDRQLSFILHHELIHFKRKDLFYKWMLVTAVAVNWFNPMIYLFSKTFTFYGEISCDEIVTEHMSEARRNLYSLTIIGLAAERAKFNSVFSTSFYGGKEGMKKRIYSIMKPSKKRLGYGLFAVCFSLILSSGTVFASMPDSGNRIYDGQKQQIKRITDEEIRKEMEVSFSEVFSNEFHEEDFPGMIITYDEDGIPVVSDPNNAAQKRAVYASVKAYKGGFYSSSDCSADSLVFYIPQGYRVEVLDSASYTDIAKVSYAGSTGYMKKSELKF